MSSTPSPVHLSDKSGTGVGASVDVFTNDANGKYVGALTFHDGHDWQVTDGSRVPTEALWNQFMVPALALARELYPTG